MMRGVMKIRSSELWSVKVSRWNSHLRNGTRLESRRPVVGRGFRARVDAADDGRLAVAHEHGGRRRAGC